jgi:pSer/pThr/pTyr-binding forkhead associated (FHA) protein
LVLTDPQGQVTEIPFEGDRMVLGRSASADVTVADPRMSRMHLRFGRGANNGLTVEDLGAANGVAVQGERVGVAPVTLQVGDRLEFGDCNLVVASAASAYAPGMSMASLPAVGSVEHGEVPPWRLVITPDGPEHIIDRPVVIGRSIGADLTIDHVSVSRRHVALTPMTNGRLRVDDVGGTNGTFIDGRRLDDSVVLAKLTPLTIGDVAVTLQPEGRRRRFKKQGKELLERVLVGLLVVVGLGLMLKGPPRPERVRFTERQRQVENGLAKAQEDQARFAWSAALPAVAGVLALDPLNRDAIGLKAQLELEVKAQKQFEDAVAAQVTGDLDTALNAFDLVAPKTRFYAKAKTQRDVVQDRLLQQYRDRAERSCQAGKWRICQMAACNHLAYRHAEGVIRLLARAEGRLLSARGFKRCAAAQKSSVDSSVAAKTVGDALATLYPDLRLRAAVQAYALGDVRAAVDRLDDVLADGQRPGLQRDASDLRHKMKTILAHSKRLADLERGGDLSMALSKWSQLKILDTGLVKGRVVSGPVRDGRSILTRFLSARGVERMGQERWEGALKDLVLARQVDPTAIPPIEALKKLAGSATVPAIAELAQKAASLKE